MFEMDLADNRVCHISQILKYIYILMIHMVINHFVTCIVISSPLLWLGSVAKKTPNLFLWTERDLLQGIRWLTILLDGLKKENLG